MFERIEIRELKQGSTGSLDLGFLVEAMLFYGQVEVVAHDNPIKQLITSCGPEPLIELLERGYLKLSYTEDMAGIQTTDAGTSRERHVPVLFKIMERNNTRHGPEHFVPTEVINIIGKQGRGRRVARRLMNLMMSRNIRDGILNEFVDDTRDTEYVYGCVTDLLRYYVPEYQLPKPMSFEFDELGQGWFQIQTNIDFQRVNHFYHLRVPPSHSTLTSSYFVSHLLNAREQLDGAAESNTELATSVAQSLVLGRRLERVIDARIQSEHQIQYFSDFVLNDGRAIREAVNSGARTMKEVIELLDRASKFKDWLRGKPDDVNLAKEYFREVTASTWVDKLPAKTTRFVLFSGIGLLLDALGAGGIGTAVGLTVGAGDTFLLDRLLRGWKPNQFIESSLSHFIAAKKVS